MHLIIAAFLAGLALVPPSPALGDKCSEHAATTCIGCHNTDEICLRLGNSEKEWQAIILWMIDNGAELQEEEVELLVQCFSLPSEGAKDACRKE